MRLVEVWQADPERAFDLFAAFPADECGFENPAAGMDRERFAAYVRELRDQSMGVGLQDGWVPSTKYVLVADDGDYVGIFNLRHRLTERLRAGAGHIGYGIAREHRGRGYATAGLLLTLARAREIGIGEAYLSVRKDNPASLAVQRHCGARIDHEDATEYYTRISTSVLCTPQLLLRPWRVDDMDDARALYRHAGNPHVGPAAGWPAHTSVQGSMRVIRDVLDAPETYAVVLRETWEPIGSIGLTSPSATIGAARRDVSGAGDFPGTGDASDESGSAAPGTVRELGYWVAEPYWGRGLIPEAGREMLRHGFEDLHLTAIWGTHDVANRKSSRVMDKLGLSPVRTARHVRMELLGDVYRDELVRRITADEWRAGA